MVDKNTLLTCVSDESGRLIAPVDEQVGCMAEVHLVFAPCHAIGLMEVLP
jgi:hypothetical protein